MSKAQLTSVAAILASLSAGAVQAMPIDKLAAIGTGAAAEQARWVCGPHRCWWRPSRYYRPYVYDPGPRFYLDTPRFYGPPYRGRNYRSLLLGLV